VSLFPYNKLLLQEQQRNMSLTYLYGKQPIGTETYDSLYYKGFATWTWILPECQQQISYYALVSSSVPVTSLFCFVLFFLVWLKSNY
jgi:hypothetical protein